MKKTQLLTLLSLLLIIKTHGQFLSSAINLKDGSSVSGFIKKFKYYPNANEIILYPQKEDKNPKQILPETISELVVEGKGSFIFEKVQIYTHELNVANSLSEKVIKETSVTISVFLRILLIGEKLTLYSYNDGNRSNYFIQKPGGQIITLRYLRTADAEGVNSIKDYRYYLQELLPYVSGNEKLELKLETVGWNEKDMVNICKAINNNTVPFALYKGSAPEPGSVFYISAGVNLSFRTFTVKFEFENSLDKIKFPVSAGPVVSLGYEMPLGSETSRFFFQPNLTLFYFQSTGINNFKDATGTNVNSRYIIKGYSIFGGAALKYKIAENFKIGTGANLHIDILSESRVISNFPSEQIANKTPISFNSFLQADYLINKKHGFTIVLSPLQKTLKGSQDVWLKSGYGFISYTYRLRRKD